MFEKPRVSIVIPNYRYARYLPRLAASLAAQTFPLAKTEIIFADDGSGDDSLAVAEQVFSALPCSRVEILALPHGGRPGPVRNAALARARGELAVCIDPDDEIQPEYLSELVAALDADPSAAVAYSDLLRDENGQRRPLALPDFDAELLKTQNILSPTAMFRLDTFRSTRGYRDNTAYEDWDLWVQFAAGGYSFTHVARPLYVYHWHGGNFSVEAQAQDGRAKAQIVLNNANFFPPQVKRWAEALLAGEAWAAPMHRGIIPREDDVRQLRRAYVKLLKRRSKG